MTHLPLDYSSYAHLSDSGEGKKPTTESKRKKKDDLWKCGGVRKAKRTMIYIIYVTRLPVGFFLDRVADGARGSIPFGKLVLGTILHFIFIINAVERRREKKIEKSEEAKERRKREKEKENRKREEK